MRKLLTTALLLSALTFTVIADDQAVPAAWKPLQFLVGNWIGGGSGKPGDAAGEFSLAFDLDKHILVRRNHAQLAAKPGEKATAHDDLMVIYPQGPAGTLRADYFDNEGHVIHYATTFASNKAIFTGDAVPNTPRFRLTYELKPDGLLAIEFAIAAPGKDFTPYVAGTAKRK